MWPLQRHFLLLYDIIIGTCFIFQQNVLTITRLLSFSFKQYISLLFVTVDQIPSLNKHLDILQVFHENFILK